MCDLVCCVSSMLPVVLCVIMFVMYFHREEYGRYNYAELYGIWPKECFVATTFVGTPSQKPWLARMELCC